MDDITGDPRINTWLSMIPTKRSRAMYNFYMKKFCNSSKLSPQDLLGLAQADILGAKGKLAEFYEDCTRTGYALNTARNALSAVRSFLYYNEIKLGRFPIARAAAQYEGNRIFTYSEVFRMLVGARTPRNRALLSFILQSGQRVGIVTKIRYGDVRRQIENSTCPVVIDVDPRIAKFRIRYSFAIGLECVDLIKAMMRKRQEWGEPIDDESILFRSLGVGVRNIGGKWTPGGAIHLSEIGKPLSTSQVGWIMRRSAAIGGVSLKVVTKTTSPSWKRFELHPHAFRRWWKSMMRKGGVDDPVFLNFMIGHAEPYQGAYDTFDHDYIKEQFAKAEPFLTFLRNSDPVKSRLETNFQRIVDEPEAANLFSEGWRYVTTLASGKLVVQGDPFSENRDTLSKATFQESSA